MTLKVSQEFRGETFCVDSPGLRCAHCGWETTDLNQLDALRVAVADAYREKHDLLTSQQIRNIRETLKLSQRKFAELLRVGEASIPRWESWKVQEEVYDKHIRRFSQNVAPKKILVRKIVQWRAAGSADSKPHERWLIRNGVQKELSTELNREISYRSGYVSLSDYNAGSDIEIYTCLDGRIVGGSSSVSASARRLTSSTSRPFSECTA